MRIVEAWTHFANDEPEKEKKNVWKQSKSEETREGGVEITSVEMKRGERYDEGRMDTTVETEVSAVA